MGRRAHKAVAIKFEKITPGMVLLDIHRQDGRWGCWKVEILSVDLFERTARVSWNGNSPKIYSERSLKRLYAKEPGFYTKSKLR